MNQLDCTARELANGPQMIQVSRDDHDWLLALGRQQGDSRIMGSQHPVAKALILQFRRSLSEGLSLPWQAANDYIRFMPGKVSIWSGPSFNGKTAFLRQLMLHAVANEHRVLFISLEEEPDEVWREFICSATTTRHPNPVHIESCLDLWDGKLFVFDSSEMIEPTLLMGIIRYAVEKYELTHIVIDSLMRLDLKSDDYNGQREMGNMLGRLAKVSKSHIHLVAHPRKTQNSREPMDMYDIRGAQDIVAQADLVMTLERKYDDDHDALLTCWKQRGDVNWIGKMKLYFDKESRQLKFGKFDQPTAYIPASLYAQ